MTELQLHVAVAQFLDLALPQSATWTTIGHGGGGVVRGSKLKRMGLKRGWPDILILHACLHAHAAHFIELKVGKRDLNKNQKVVHGEIKRAGGLVAVCRSIAEVEGTLKGWAIPLKARAA